jgi:hypothetical protein
MQLILNDEFGGQLVGFNVEDVRNVRGPGQRCELVRRSDEKRRAAAVNVLVDH